MSELDKQDQNNPSVVAPKPNSMPNIADLKRPELRSDSVVAAQDVEINLQADVLEKKISAPPPPPPRANAALLSGSVPLPPPPPPPVASAILPDKSPVGFSVVSSLNMLNASTPTVEEKTEQPRIEDVAQNNHSLPLAMNSQDDVVILEKNEEEKPVSMELELSDSEDGYIDDIASAIEKMSEDEQIPEPEPSATEPVISEENIMQKQDIVQDMVEIEEMATKQHDFVANQAASTETAVEMSNIISQVVFDEILRQHKEWLISDGREGRRANLHSLDLRHINFGDANLQQSNMRATLLSGVNLSRAILIDADLTEATLEGVQAVGANWSRINLSNVNLTNANLAQTNLSYANLFRTNLFSANLEETNLENANLRDAIMSHADFSNAYLKDAVCRGADLTKAIFNRTNLTNVDMRECLCNKTEFLNAILDNTSFKNAHFENMSFTTADFTNALDIPLEYQNKGFKLEKENIEQEKNELKQMEAEIQHKQKELMEMRLQMEEQRNLIGSLKADEQVYVSNLQGILGHLKLIRIMWGVVFALTLICTGLTIASIEIESLHMMELGVVLLAPILIMLLVLYTFSQVSGARKRITHHSMIRERKIGMLQQGKSANEDTKPLSSVEKISSTSKKVSSAKTEDKPKKIKTIKRK